MQNQKLEVGDLIVYRTNSNPEWLVYGKVDRVTNASAWVVNLRIINDVKEDGRISEYAPERWSIYSYRFVSGEEAEQIKAAAVIRKKVKYIKEFGFSELPAETINKIYDTLKADK